LDQIISMSGESTRQKQWQVVEAASEAEEEVGWNMSSTGHELSIMRVASHSTQEHRLHKAAVHVRCKHSNSG
jgi:hypothetical protein